MSIPAQVFDTGVQHERTALAWERTAIAIMVNGVLLARYAADDGHWVLAFIGLAETIFGSGVLVWAGFHYQQLHGPLRTGQSVVHPTSARVVGAATLTFIAASLVLAVLLTLTP